MSGKAKAKTKMERARKERARKIKEKVSPRISMAKRWCLQRRMAESFAMRLTHRGVLANVVVCTHAGSRVAMATTQHVSIRNT